MVRGCPSNQQETAKKNNQRDEKTMTTFIVQPQNQINTAFAGTALKKSQVISALEMTKDGTQHIPLISVSPPSEDFPLDVSLLADNFAALLSDSKQPHALNTEGSKIYYRPLSCGVSLHHRKADGGVSKEGLLFVVSDKASSKDLGETVISKITPAFMKKLCDAIEMNGPSADPSGVHPKAPAL